MKFAEGTSQSEMSAPLSNWQSEIKAKSNNLPTGQITPWKSKQNKGGGPRMAGDYLAEFTQDNESNVMGVLGKQTGARDWRNGTTNKSKSNNAIASSSSSSSSGGQSQPQSYNSDNATNGMAGYVAPKPETWSPQNPETYSGFQGGTPGVDSPDPNYGQIITSPSGTKTQYGKDGSMMTWGTDEALASAVQAKQDAKASVQNYRPIDYDTNLPDNFDPGGKDQLAHNDWLCELTGSSTFCDKSAYLRNTYG